MALLAVLSAGSAALSSLAGTQDKWMKCNVFLQAGASEKDLMVLSGFKLYKSKKW